MTRRNQQRSFHRPAIEPLEKRCLLAVTAPSLVGDPDAVVAVEQPFRAEDFATHSMTGLASMGDLSIEDRFDVDGDGQIDVGDALLIINRIQQGGGSSFAQDEALDLDNSGDVTAKDALWVINRIAAQPRETLMAEGLAEGEGLPATYVARHRMTSSQYNSEVSALAAQGYRPVRVSGYELNGQAYYAAIWHPTDGVTWQARHGLTSAQYQQEFTALVGQGYRPASVNGYTVAGVDYYAAVFELRTGPSWVARHRMTNSQYQSEFNQWTSQGYRPISVSGYSINNVDYYTGVWELSTGPSWGARHGMTSAGYQQQYNNFDAAGFDLVDVSGYDVNGTTRYTALWEARPGFETVGRHGMTSAQYQSEFNSLSALGYQLIDVDGYNVGGSDRYAASWAKVDSQFTEVPITGTSISHLEVMDDAVEQFMVDRQITAGSVAISKNGKLLYEKAFGWSDKEQTTALQTDSMFRLASVVKPITSAAINKLIAAGSISRNDQVFCVAGGSTDCLLDISPFGTPDARLTQINVGHLLDHRAGWDRDVSGDPMFQQLQIANDLGIPSPPSKHNIARHVLGRTLDFTPGARYAYSNFGYLVLGLIIEKFAETDYTVHIQDELFNPIGVADTEIELGRSLVGDRNPREPWYSDPFSGTNLFNTSQSVPWPDGAFHLESMDSHGGLIATAESITRFLDEYWISGQPRNGGSQNWTFFGSLPGTVTMARQRPDGLNIAVLFNNRRDTANAIYNLNSLKNTIDTVADGIDWPVPSVGHVEVNQGEQNRSNVAELEVTFSAHVDAELIRDAFRLTNVNTATEVTSLIVDPPVNVGETTKVTLRFGPGPSVVDRGEMGHSLADGNYRLDIDDAMTRGAYFGRMMAADYVFGSLDPNNPGEDGLFRLFGDSDGDRDVDGQDYGRFGLSFLKVTGVDGFDPKFDSDGDGDVDGQDYGRFGQRFLKTI